VPSTAPEAKLLLLATLSLVACSSSSPTTTMLTRDQLLDPTTCQGCHPDQYSQWSGSMHAYSTKDPVFVAMNQRGQRETAGQLGKFCVNCHAPMAVQEGATTDGLNLDQVPAQLHGVTCFFCHSVASVNGTHNNPLTLTTDNILLGPFTDPLAAGRTHLAGYSELVDRQIADSSGMCGSCHDIQAPPGGHIERTFEEWNASAFPTVLGETCAQCHMPQSTELVPVANVPNAPLRRAHDHSMPGVDVALTDFPNKPQQLSLVQASLDPTLQSALCVESFGGGAKVSAIVDNAAAGHSFPSGSAQDRRAWFEVTAYSGATVVYSSGVVPAGTPVVSLPDPDLWLLRDCMFAPDGGQVDMFWNAASYDGNALPAIVTFDISSPDFYLGHKQRFYPPSGVPITTPDRITLKVHVTPIGLDVLNDLVASGDLDAGFLSVMPTFDIGNTLEWTLDAGTHTYVDRDTGGLVFCATTTSLNVQADRFPAPQKTLCAP
jgi:Cytochrome c554 and c-prime